MKLLTKPWWRGIAFLSLLLLFRADLSAQPPGHTPAGLNNRPHLPGKLLVKFRPAKKKEKIKEFLRGYGAKLKNDEALIPNLAIYEVILPPFAAGLDENTYARAFKADPDVEIASPDFRYELAATPNDPQYSQQWHLPKINAPLAWDSTTGLNTIKIAILDTGVNAHPDLNANLIAGWNVHDNTSNTQDLYGHGTAVAGVAAAVANNGTGVAGVAWFPTVPGYPKIMPIRVSGPEGYTYSSFLLKGLIWAADNGARIANMSYSEIANDPIIDIGAYYFQTHNGIVVASAGINWALSAADDPFILSVNATDQNDAIAEFCFPGTYADIAAPGVAILTTDPAGGYQPWSGTSLSSPIAAGVAALVMSKNPNLSGAQVAQVIKQSATDKGPVGYDLDYGAGLINASAAVALAPAGPTPTGDTTPPTIQISSPTAGQTVSSYVVMNLSVNDNVGINAINLYVDGAMVWVNSTGPYDSAAWDSQSVLNGQHVLRVEAVDKSFNVASASVTVNVNNQVDTTPPRMGIGCPRDNSTFSGVRDVTVDGRDDGSAIASMSIAVDGGAPISTITGSNWRSVFSWDTRPLSNGNHTLTATVRDIWGNSSSASMPITIRNVGTDLTPPPQVRLVSPPVFQHTTDHTPTFEWSPVSDPSGVSYRLLVSRDSHFPLPAVIDTTVTGSTYTPTTLLPTGEYYWRVDAIDGNLNAESCGEIWVMTVEDQDITAPATPTLVTPVNGSSAPNIVTFTWNTITDPSNVFYEIQIDNSGSTFPSPEVNVSNIITNSYSRYAGLSTGTYSWRVRARDGASPPNVSTWSTPWTVTITASSDTTPPGTPSLSFPADGVSTADATQFFDWTDVTDPSGVGYWIQVDNSGSTFPSPEIDIIGYISSAYIPLTPFSPGTYSWRVRAFDGAGLLSNWSAVRTLTIVTDSTPPTRPNLIAPLNNTSTGTLYPVFDWSDSSDVNEITYELLVTDDFDYQVYYIYKWDIPTSLFNTSLPTPGGTFLSLSPGSYAWRVRAFDGVNYSSWTPTWRFTIPPETGLPAQTGLISPVNGASIENPTPLFEWAYVNGGWGYELVLYDSQQQVLLNEVIFYPYLLSPISLSPGTYSWKTRTFSCCDWPPRTYSAWTPLSTFTVLPRSPGGDRTGPSVSITYPAPGAIITGFQDTVSATASDTGGILAVRFNIDDSVIVGTSTGSPYQQTVVWDSLPNGPHTLQAEAFDTSGNRSTASITVTVNDSFDSGPPWISLYCPQSGARLSGTRSIIVDAGDPNGGLSSFVLSVDGNQISSDITSPFNFSWNTTTVGNGNHTLRLDATDYLGKSYRTEIPVTVMNNGSDVTAPPAPDLLAPLQGATTASLRPIFDWADVTDASGVAYKLILQRQGWPDLPPVISFSGLTTSTYTPTADLMPGYYFWRVEVSDGNGNVESCGASRQLIIPNTYPVPPAPTLISPAAGATIPTIMPLFSWSDVSAPSEEYNIQVDNNSDFSSPVTGPEGGVTAYTFATSYGSVQLAAGTYYWRVAATTSATGPWSASRSFTINPAGDTTAPAAPTLSAPATGTLISSQSPTLLDWTDVTDTNGVLYDLSGIPNQAISMVNLSASSYTIYPGYLADGTYTWQVRAKDRVGNLGPLSASWTFKIDKTAPTVPSPVSPANGSTTSDTTPTFTWNASTEANGTPLYRLEILNSNLVTHFYKTNISGTTFTPTTALVPGLYYWRIGAEDTMGNSSAMTAQSSLRVSGDTTAPLAPVLISPQNGNVASSNTPTFDWANVSDPSGVTYRIQADNSGTSFPSPEVNLSNLTASYYAQTTPLTNGNYSWRVMATDSAGNAGPWSAVWALGVGVAPPTPPTISLSVPPNNYIDPFDDLDPANPTTRLGIQTVSITFSEPVSSSTGGALSRANNFQITYHGPATPGYTPGVDIATGLAPTVTMPTTTGVGPYVLTFNPRLPLGVWTKIRAVNVIDADGAQIPAGSDTIILGFLPLDLTQDGYVGPEDTIRWIQINNGSDPAPLTPIQLLDQRRDGVLTPDDIIRAIQLSNGLGTARSVGWGGFNLGSPP